jgi:hypothetical protein
MEEVRLMAGQDQEDRLGKMVAVGNLLEVLVGLRSTAY